MSTDAGTPAATSADEAVIDPDYPVTPVPPHARKSFFSLMIVLLGFTIFTPTMLAGAELGSAFALGDLLVVILSGPWCSAPTSPCSAGSAPAPA